MWVGVLDFDEYCARVLMQAWVRADAFVGTTVSQWLGWLRQIGRTVALSELRNQNCRRVSETLWAAGHSAAASDSTETTERIEFLLGALEPHEARVLCWRVDEELSFAEIGRYLGVSAAAARQVYCRILKKLRRGAEKS